jgi:hypothetical protein
MATVVDREHTAAPTCIRTKPSHFRIATSYQSLHRGVPAGEVASY